MGWFLLGNPKKSRKTRRKPTRTDQAARRHRWRVGLKVAAEVLVVMAVATGWYFGEDYLAEQVGQKRQAETMKVVFVDRPVWLNDDRGAAMAELVLRAVAADPLDHGSLVRASAQLAANPWVERVDRLVRRPGGVVEVHAHYRRPAALVAGSDGYHLVDPTGCRLPGLYPFEQVRSLGLIAIVGAAGTPPAVGRRWSGQDVTAGLKLIRRIAGQPFAGQVKAVDVSNYGGQIDPNKPQLRLLTERGTIRWGRAPGEEGVYEPDAARKIRMLLEVAGDARSHGKIDADGQVVDVFGDTPMIHRQPDWSPGRPEIH